MNRIFLISLCLLFFSCSKTDSQGGQQARLDPTGQKIVPGGTLVAGIISEPDVLNPLMALSRTAQNVLAVLYRQLGKLNTDMVSYSPELAKAWFFSEDSLAITFQLRTDVFWHDSTLFTANDVLFTYALQTDPTIGWVGISLKQNIRVIEAPNDSTVIFRFTKRTPTMLTEAIEGYIVPQHILGKLDPAEIPNSPFNRQPVGTGPFKFKDWTSQQTLVLERFEAYYKPGKPYLDRIIFMVVSDNINLWLQVKSGDVDFMEGVPARDFNNLVLDWEVGNSNVRPLRYPGRQYDFIGWNLIDYDNYSTNLAAADDNQPEISAMLEPNTLFGSQKLQAENAGAVIAVGLEEKPMIDKFYRLGARFFIVDVANGFNAAVEPVVKYLRNLNDVFIICGNVDSKEGFAYLSNLGVQAIRVGIGTGSMCTTSIMTGVGQGIVSSIVECRAAKDELRSEALLIADGGIRTAR